MHWSEHKSGSLLKIRELPQEARNHALANVLTTRQHSNINLLARALITTRVLVQIKLVISLSIPPLRSRQNLRNNSAVLPPLLLHLLSHFTSLLLLFFAVRENAAAVLGAGVGTLTVLGCGIVHLVEEFEEGAVRYFVRVESDLESFGVCGEESQLLIPQPATRGFQS